METIIFYEKPGCITNSKQKSLLRKAGYSLKVENLLTHSWTVEELQSYMQGLSVGEWFNRAAPKVKSGRVNPDIMTADEALAALCDAPILIRRPLISFNGRKIAGFDEYRLRESMSITLTDSRPRAGTDRDLESCSNNHAQAACAVE
ncbi:hypothetical protein NBRC116494_22490 [Aurantivibrio plasticivorans]